MAVEIVKVTTNRQLKRFVRFNYELYKDNPYFVPELFEETMDTLRKDRNAAFEFCEADYFLAYRDGKIVGRIAAIINPHANEKWGCKAARFGWVDFIDDNEVVDALFSTAEEWARERGMTEIQGPLGFTDFDPEGMLVDGFDRISTLALIYNHPYYPEHMKKLGYTKETGWVEYRLTIPEEVPERLERLSEVVLNRYNLKLIKKTSSQIKKENYGQKVFNLINQTYCKLYGYSLLSEKQIDAYVNQYLGFVDARMLSFVEDENGDLIGTGLTIPSLAKALQKCRGELMPFGWWQLLKTMYIKRPDTLEMLLIGVRPDYQNKGVPTLIFTDLIKIANSLGFRYGETNANLETNTAVQALWEPFEKEQRKKRWVFGKDIE